MLDSNVWIGKIINHGDGPIETGQLTKTRWCFFLVAAAHGWSCNDAGATAMLQRENLTDAPWQNGPFRKPQDRMVQGAQSEIQFCELAPLILEIWKYQCSSTQNVANHPLGATFFLWSFFCLQERYFLFYKNSTRVGMGQIGRNMPKLDDLVPNMKTSCACFLQVEHAPNSCLLYPRLWHFVGFIQILWGISQSDTPQWRWSREHAKPLNLAVTLSDKPSNPWPISTFSGGSRVEPCLKRLTP